MLLAQMNVNVVDAWDFSGEFPKTENTSYFYRCDQVADIAKLIDNTPSYAL